MYILHIFYTNVYKSIIATDNTKHKKVVSFSCAIYTAGTMEFWIEIMWNWTILTH